METRKQALHPTAISLAIAIVVVLLLQCFIVTGWNTPPSDEGIVIQRTVAGYVYWPNGTLDTSMPLPLTVTNNNTGTSITTLVSLGGEYAAGTYRVEMDSSEGDIIFVNITWQNMWAMNESVVGVPNVVSCNQHLVDVPFGPKLVQKASGATITGFGGTVTLNIPGAALIDSSALIYGFESDNQKAGSMLSVNLGPDGTMFDPPATLSWSYSGIDIGDLSPESLAVFTYTEDPMPTGLPEPTGQWEKLPSVVDKENQLVIAQVSHFSNFSLGGAEITGQHAGINQTYRGSLNVPVLDLAVTNTDPSVPDTLDYIHIVYNGNEPLDITGVSLWNDTDNDGVADSLLKPSQALVGGNVNITVSETLPANTTLNILVCVDVDPAAALGNFIDLMIPMNGAGLANAGLNLDPVDPAGDLEIIQELADPHIVYGRITNVFGNVSHAWVNITNNRTGIVENLMTDEHGRYEVNLGLMFEGYANGDEIFIVANDTFGQAGWNNTLVNTGDFGEECNIHLNNTIIAENEYPSNGSIIADLQQNITVNITTTGLPLDAITIILEVNGINYTWPDPALSFSVDTLVFDTVTAIGTWSMGQVINVTLWQANDTIGNTCSNAPYSWSFSIIMEYVQAPGNLTLSNNASAVQLDWDPVNYSFGYNVYRSMDRFAAWPWPKIADNITSNNWTDVAGTYDDANTYHYIVTAWNPAGEGANSSMGTKVRKTFTYNDPSTKTNSNWISMPYDSKFTQLSDIVIDIEGGTTGADRDYIMGVYYWNAPTQQRVGITWTGFGWNLGNDKVIEPGDGICLVLSDSMTIGQQFNWTIVGVDRTSTQNFTYNNPSIRTNTNWISMPFTSDALQLSDIVVAIEGGTTGADRDYIMGVYYWNPATQQRVGITWTGFGWNLGNDIVIQPGDAICLVLSDSLTIGQTFSWEPSLIVEPVPNYHYYD